MTRMTGLDHTLDHVGLTVADLGAYHELLGRGATDRMSPRPSPEAGVRMADVADPEGNLIELLDRRAARALGSGRPANHHRGEAR